MRISRKFHLNEQPIVNDPHGLKRIVNEGGDDAMQCATKGEFIVGRSPFTSTNSNRILFGSSSPFRGLKLNGAKAARKEN